MEERDKTYNIYAEKVVLLDVNDRKYVVKGLGQSNIWYGNEEEDRKVETIFDDTGRILISERLDDNNRMYMNITAKMKIDITEENIKYIKYHRKNVFIEK